MNEKPRNLSGCQTDAEKHNITFDKECWEKLKVLAGKNGMTISAVVNGIIKSVSDIECRMSVEFAESNDVELDENSNEAIKQN